MKQQNKFVVNDRSQNVRSNNHESFLKIKEEQQRISAIIEQNNRAALMEKQQKYMQGKEW